MNFHSDEPPTGTEESGNGDKEAMQEVEQKEETRKLPKAKQYMFSHKSLVYLIEEGESPVFDLTELWKFFYYYCVIALLGYFHFHCWRLIQGCVV